MNRLFLFCGVALTALFLTGCPSGTETADEVKEDSKEMASEESVKKIAATTGIIADEIYGTEKKPGGLKAEVATATETAARAEDKADKAMTEEEVQAKIDKSIQDAGYDPKKLASLASKDEVKDVKEDLKKAEDRLNGRIDEVENRLEEYVPRGEFEEYKAAEREAAAAAARTSSGRKSVSVGVPDGTPPSTVFYGGTPADYDVVDHVRLGADEIRRQRIEDAKAAARELEEEEAAARWKELKGNQRLIEQMKREGVVNPFLGSSVAPVSHHDPANVYVRAQQEREFTAAKKWLEREYLNCRLDMGRAPHHMPPGVNPCSEQKTVKKGRFHDFVLQRRSDGVLHVTAYRKDVKDGQVMNI